MFGKNRGLGADKKEILQKGINVLFIRGFGYVFGFLFTWVLANKYGPYVQGVFSIAFIFLSVGTMIAKLGIETALVKWIANAKGLEEEKIVYSKSIKITLSSAIIVAVIIFILAPWIAQIYNKPDVENSIKVAAIAIPFLALLDVSSGYFKGASKTTTYGIYFYLLKFFAPFIILTAFYLVSVNIVETPMISYLIGLFLIAISISVHIFTILGRSKTKIDTYFSSRHMLSESYPMMISSAIVMIMGWSDVFILGFYVSEEKIGIYSTAIKIAALVSFIYNAIATITASKIARLYRDKLNKEMAITIQFSAKTIFFASLPIFLVLFTFPEFLLGLFGEQYVQGKVVLRVLLVAQLTNALTGLVGPIFQMTGNQKRLQQYITMSLIINIVLSLLLVNSYGYEGVALASALGMISWNIIGAIFIYRKMNIRTWVNF